MMLASFILATTLISLAPGPSMAIIVANAADKGFLAGIQTTLGAVLADAILLILALSGLGAALHASVIALTALKWLGVGYLVYLGVMQFRARETSQSRARPGINNAFLQGLGSTILNPKIIGFLIVYFPQFLTQQESFLRQMLVLGPLFLLIVFLVFTLCVIAASQLRHLLNSSSGRQSFRRVSGLSLIGCGVYLATI